MKWLALAVAGLAAAAGCGRIAFDLADADLVDRELPGQFGDGVFENTSYQDGVVLAGGTTGTFTSRVFARPVSTVWSTLSWIPAAPYRKALPDGRGAEAGYEAGNVDMRANVVLLHLDGTGGVVAGDAVSDASGRGNDFEIVDAPNATTVRSYMPALFGNGLEKDKSFYARRDIPAQSDLQFGPSDFTWALWARPTYCSPSNTTFWGNEDTDISPHIWMGCGPCGIPDSFEGYYRGATPPDGVGGCAAPTPMIDGVWHHVAVVKSSTTNTVSYRYFVDGVSGAPNSGPADPTVVWQPPAELDFLAFHISSFPDSIAVGRFDEAAIWTRALSDAELDAVWQRGALDLSLQVRFCREPDCADGGAFVGPDATSATAFRDPSSGLGPPDQQSLDAVGNTARPFAQYRMSFSTLRAPATPLVKQVAWDVR